MATPTLDLKIRILADGSAFIGQTKLTREEMVRLKEEFGGASKASNQLNGSMGGAIDQMKGLVAAYLGFSAIQKLVIENTAKFDRTLAEISGIGDFDKVDAQFSLMRQKALDVGMSTTVGANDSAVALKNLTANGLAATDAIYSLGTTLKIASAGEMAIGDAANIATEQMNSFKLSVKDLDMIGGVMAKAANMSSASVKDFALAGQYAGGVFQSIGWNIQDMGTSIAMLKNVGLDASIIGTSLRDIVGDLAAPTEHANQTMKQLGLVVADNSGKVKPFTVLMKELNQSLQGYTDVDKARAVEQIFGKTSQSAVLELIKQSDTVTDIWGNKFPTALEQTKAKLLDTAGALDKMSERKTDDLRGEFDKLKASSEGLGITIGTIFTPMMIESTKGLTTIVRELNEALVDANRNDGLKSAFAGTREVYDSAAAAQAASIAAARAARGEKPLEKDANFDINSAHLDIASLETGYKAVDMLALKLSEADKAFISLEKTGVNAASSISGALDQFGGALGKVLDPTQKLPKMEDLLPSAAQIDAASAALQKLTTDTSKLGEQAVATKHLMSTALQNVFTELQRDAATAGMVESEKKVWEAREKYGANAVEVAKMRGYQADIEAGKNELVLKKMERGNQALQESVGLTGVQLLQTKALSQLETEVLDKNSAKYKAERDALFAKIEAQQKYEAAIKATETLDDLRKSTAATRVGSAGIELFDAKKSLGVGATDAQAQAVVTGQLAKSLAEKNLAAKQEYELSLLTEPLRAVEIKRRELGATATTEQAKGLVELNKITKANNEIAAAQRDVAAAGLTQPAREYLKIMQDIGEVQGVQLINLKNIAAAQTAGVTAKASLEKELMLAQMSTKDADKFKTLESVAPAQRAEINALLEQKNQIDKVKQSWDNAATAFTDYAQQVVTGKMSFGKALDGFLVKINEDQIKEAFEKVKTMLTKQPVTLEGALNFSDAKARQDVSAASAVFKTYETSLMTGTDGSVNKLITGIDTSISKLTQAIDSSLSKLAANIPKATAANEAVYRQAANDSVVKSLNIDSNLTSREGLRVKGGIDGQAFAGGKNAAGLTALAQLIQKAEGDLLTRFTAFNDKYHAGTSSMHAKGLALDFSVKDASKSAEAAKIVTDLGKKLGVALKVIDEYKDPSARATGGHIHVNFKSQADADKLLQNVTGKVGQAIDIHTQALDTHKTKIIESAQTHEAHGHVINAHAERVNVDSNALAKHSDKTLIDTSKADVMPWGTPAKSGAELTGMFSGVKIDTSQGEKTPWGASYQTSNEIVGGYSGFMGGVGAAGSQLLSGNLSGAADIGKGLMGSYGSEIMGGVNIAKSLFSGDKAGALGGAISLGVTAALTPVLGPFASIAGGLAGQLGGKVFGNWTVESKNLTASIQGLSGTFKEKTIEVNKGMIGGGKRTTYTDVSFEQNKQLQAALKSVTTEVDTIGKQLGQSLIDTFRANNFRKVIDIVHEQTGTFEQQWQKAQAAMVKESVLGANVAGVDTSITDVMAGKVSILMKSAGDGVYDKALQSFMWKPDTQKYAKEINGPIKDGLNSLISSTDWQGLDISQTTAKLQTYLTDSFSKAGVNVPTDTFKSMAEDLTGQIQNGLKFLETSKNTVNPDAPFFKNMREIVNNFDAWNSKPEEVTAFITSITSLKDAFKTAQIGTQNITQSLLDMAGGSDKVGALTANVNAYSAAFLDDASKNSTKIASLTTDVSSAFAVFGVQMPKTKTDFVALTNSIDMTTDSGKKAFVALMDIAPKYAELAQLQATAGVGLDMFSAKLAELPKISSNVASAMTNSLNSSVQNKVGAAQAGKDLGRTMAGEIQKSLAGMVTDTISSMVIKGLVTPMLQAGVQNANMTLQAGAMSAQNLAIGGSNAAANLTMGGNNAAQGMTAGSNNAATGLSAGGSTAAAALAAGGQIAADYISGLTTQIITTIEIMGKVMADPALKKAMETVTSATEKVGESAYTMMTDTNSYLAQDFSISAASSQSAANSSGGGGTDTAANDAKTLADSLKKLHESLTDLETGLTGNELTINKLSRAYGNVDLSMVNLSGNSTDVAKSLNSLSDTQLQSIATAAGKTIDELSSDMQSYVNILRDQTKALTDFRNGLDKYTSAGENNTARTKDLTREMMLMGVSAEQAVGYIKTLSDADLSAKAKTLNMTSEELRGTVIPAVLQGMMDFETGLKDLKNNTLSTYTVGRKTDSTSVWVEQLSTEAAKLGLTAKTAAAWIETLKPEELEAYATKMGVTRDQLIKDVIPQTLTSINSVGEAFRNLGLDMQALTDKSFTPAQRTIATLAETYPNLNIAQLTHSTTSEQLAKYYQSLSKDQIVEFAASIHKLPEDVIKDGLSLVNAMRDNETAAKSVADSWIENFKRVTDSIDSLSTSIKGDIGTVTGKKGLSDSITAAKTSTDYTYNQQIADINTTYDAAPQTDKTAAMLDKVAATEQAYTDSVSTFNSQRATIIANFTSQYAQQNDALRAKIFAPYQGTKANILQDPDELSKRVASANELRQALTSQFSEQKKAIEDKYKLESDNAAKLLDAAKQIGNTIRDLRLDSSLSTLTKKQQLGESRAAFNDLVSKAINNNDAAAASEAIAMSKTVLGKGRDYSASGKDYTELFGDVTSKLGNIKTKFGDVSTSDKTKPFEQTAYADELKALQLSTVAQLKEIDTAGQWVKEHGTEELATGLINLGSQFGLDIGQVTATLKENFPALGDRLQGVINAIDKISTKGTVSDAQINEYVQGAIKRAGGVNANSVKDITDTAKYFDIAPDRMASALGTDTATVSKTAAAYGQSYNNISDKQITSFVQDATAKYGTGTEEGVTAIYNAAKDNGVTSGQLASAIGWTDQDVLDMAQKYNLPAFAEGGFVDKPTIALVGEAGPEYIVPASRLQSAPSSGADNTETNALLQRLIAAHQETQRILQLLLQAEQQSGQKIVGELQQQPRETARLIGQKIDALSGK